MKKKIILVLSLLLLGIMGCSDFANPLSSDETFQIMDLSGGNENGSGGNENGSGGNENGSGGNENGSGGNENGSGGNENG